MEPGLASLIWPGQARVGSGVENFPNPVPLLPNAAPLLGQFYRARGWNLERYLIGWSDG